MAKKKTQAAVTSTALLHSSARSRSTRRILSHVLISQSDGTSDDPVSDPVTLAEPSFKAPMRKAPPRQPKAVSAVNKRAISVHRSSSISSLETRTEDGASNYETPGSSTAATPAEAIAGKGSIASTGKITSVSAPATTSQRPRISAAARARELAASRYSLSSSTAGKRKRNVDEDEAELGLHETLDTLLAHTLQNEEDAEALLSGDGPQTRRLRVSGRTGRGKKTKVEDSVGESDVTSGLSTVASTTPALTRSPSPLSLPGRRSRLPTRAARTSARKSITATSGAKLKGEASEDGDDLSELDSLFSEEDSDMFTEEEDERLRGPDAETVDATTGGRRATQARSRGRQRLAVRSRGGQLSRIQQSRAEREREKLYDHHPEFATMWDDLTAVPVIVPVAAQQPSTMTRQLKSFQLEGLDWMVKQEKTKWKGGLLGDEMGMGKTIQAVALIMSDYPAKQPTLVVVPPVALMQWQNEIRDYTNGKLKVLVFHGVQAKKLSIKDLQKYDVLMTSFSTLEVMHRKETKGLPRKDMDGSMVLVKSDSPLHAIHFHRVILDEAHSIKSRDSGSAKACYALKADYRWCLSGTPLQNRIGEFFSLFRFLGVKPFACYMCKVCPCTQVHWSVNSKTRRCTICKHRGFDHVSLFNLELLDPIIKHGHIGPGKVAYKKLQHLKSRIMLRREKKDHSASMELPPKDIVIHRQFFSEVERDFASSIMANTNRQFDTYVAQGVMLNNYANIFGLITQMRQVADHPDLILRGKAQGGQNVLVCCICDDAAEEAISSACHHDFCRACVKSYMKSFEQDGTQEDPDCPRCHIPLAIDLEQEARAQDEEAVKKSSIINRIKMENWTSSTKIEMLVYELAMLRSPKRTVKSIVFSQFTSMLQLVEWRLRRAGFNTVMLDGTMTPTQRQSSIDYFMKNPDVEVFLVSLKAGGVALNLTEASQVYLIDPWWNPAAEWQSADRCHRIGQTRPCTITRLVIEDSVESRMVLLQEKKARMIQGTINADESAMQNLAPEDLQFLFRGA
ncbi:MAG: DNA repair protein rad16 [Thelocarpon superellum]|nr:MAG: DNA repair protein rad16 [Thelocarpon superellum]